MKLRTRLILSLLLVLLTSTLLAFVMLRFSARSLFQGYVFSGDKEKAKIYAAFLAEYYREKGSWSEVQTFLSEIPEILFNTIDSGIHESGSTNPYFSPKDLEPLLTERVILADKAGMIVADTAKKLMGTAHPPRHLEIGSPVVLGSERVGTVLIGSMIDSSLTEPAEGFLVSMSRTFLLTGFVSTVAAFLLGLFFTLRITKTLLGLAEAADRIGRGEFEVGLLVSGNDEIANLALAFNTMAIKLRKLEEDKKRIISDSAHEIRTPLTLIQGSIEGMIDGIFPADQENLKSVHEETVRLAHLVDDLRELELIDSGRLVLHTEEVDLADLVRKAVLLFQPSAREKDIEIRLALNPLTLVCDPLRIGEVFRNLLSNAIRHTPRRGHIAVSAEEDRKAGAVRLEVADSGPGVPDGDKTRIFDRFYRTDTGRSTQDGGRGLGLSIAREIVLAHGGDIVVGKSLLGGASFQVMLPHPPDSPRNEPSPHARRD